jgi:hypothetical protein
LPGKADLIVTGIGDGEYQIIAGSLVLQRNVDGG